MSTSVSSNTTSRQRLFFQVSYTVYKCEDACRAEETCISLIATSDPEDARAKGKVRIKPVVILYQHPKKAFIQFVQFVQHSQK